MYKVHFKGKTIECGAGENLRKVLLGSGLSPYNGAASSFNCHGLGTCGTCALEVLSGKVSPPTSIEKWRLAFPPHEKGNQLRLACQCAVQSDLELQKHSGFWGQNSK